MPRSASRNRRAACWSKAGVTEVTSSVYRDGTDVRNSLVMGTYVVFESDSAYSEECFREYSMLPDKTGKYACLYRPIHMIGLELGISVASAALRKEPTGAPIMFNSDVVATAKRALKAGEMLDGEGGFCVWGKQTPADGLARRGLSAARARPQRQAQDRHRRRPAPEMERCRLRSRQSRREGPARDGGRLRAPQYPRRVTNFMAGCAFAPCHRPRARATGRTPMTGMSCCCAGSVTGQATAVAPTAALRHFQRR